MFLVITKYLTPKGFRGLTIYPFVFIKNDSDKNNTVFINHEKIHLRQQLEMLIILFYFWYIIEYCFRLIQYKNRNLAYRNICFEREAYSNETNLNYLKSRKSYRFSKYLKIEK